MARPFFKILFILYIEYTLELLAEFEFNPSVHLSSYALIGILNVLIDDQEASDQRVHELDLLLSFVVIAVEVGAFEAQEVLFHVFSREFKENLTLESIILPFLDWKDVVVRTTIDTLCLIWTGLFLFFGRIIASHLRGIRCASTPLLITLFQ